jgi:hypothetical protein
MRPKLLALNVLLGALGATLVLYIAWELGRPAPVARSRATPSAPPAVSPTPPPRAFPTELPAAWSVIATRNLFSPTRNEGPVTPPTGGAASQLPKPMLYGVVLRDGGGRIAYLEDPVTKRVAAYRVGDVVSGSTIQSISADHVVLTRPEGTVDIRLHDPTKPKAPPPPPGAPGVAPGMPPVPPTPGFTPPVPPGFLPPPPQPGMQPPTGQVDPDQPGVRPPVRRPLPPNLYRRIPPPPSLQTESGDATDQ